MSDKFAFTPAHYAKYKMKQLEGKQNVPDDVVSKVKAEIDNRRINTPTKFDIKQIMRDLKLQRYYDNIPSIYRIINKYKELTKTTLNEPMECPVCLEQIVEAIKLECKHLFCSICIEQIKKDDTIKCPLCRKINDAIEFHDLSEADQKTILDEFTLTQDQYKIGKNFISFDEIIKDICQKKGIKL